jgi:hypothetical protein
VAVHTEIQAQREADQTRAPSLPLFTTRVSAVFDAAEAHASGEEGSAEGLRQSLIDLAACSEALASQLPPPDQWPEAIESEAAIRQRLAVAEAPPPQVRVRWTPELIVGAMHRFVDLHGRLPATADWVEKGADHPTTQTVRNQFGSWSAGLRAAGYEVGNKTAEKVAAA